MLVSEISVLHACVTGVHLVYKAYAGQSKSVIAIQLVGVSSRVSDR